MSRLLYDDLDPEDVLLADLAYGSYMDLALVQPPGADAVFRSSPCPSDGLSRSAKNWGLATIKSSGTSPSTVPSTLCESELVAVPESLTVREVCLRLTRRGFRDQQIIVVTTLLDAKRYSARHLTVLYGLRWQAAFVNLRHLKTTLKLERLTAKTPVMVRKEIWTHLFAYTLLRTLMWQAAIASGNTPFQLSLQGARQMFNQMGTLLATMAKRPRKRLYQILLFATGNRPVACSSPSL